MKAIAYIRVSSEDQVSGNGIDRQRDYANDYCQRAGLSLANTLVDDGYSAFKGHHISEGKLGTFLKEVDAGRHRGSALLIEYLDRLSRLGITETFALIVRLRTGGVELHETKANRVIRSLDDLGTSIMTLVDSYQAQEYSKKLSERIAKGWAARKAAAAKGAIVTRNLPAWLKIEDGKIVKNEKADLLREAFRLAGLGIGSKNILKRLNGSLAGSKGYSLSWLTRSMANRAVLGEYQPHRYENGRRVPDGDVIPNYFPAIITQSAFDAARAEAARKNRIPDTKRYRAGDRFSDRANNLFSGLMKDVTSQPERGMNFTTVNGIQYLSSVFSPDGRKAGRIKYKKFETAFLGFLKDLDWKSVAGASESDEEKAARAALEAVLSDLDRTARRIASKTEAMDDEELDAGALRVLAGAVAKDEARVTSLEAEKTRLQLIVEAARAQSGTLHSPEALLSLITAGDNETRLRLRAEIRRRISRIEFTFGFSFAGLGAGGWTKVRIRFINGTERLIILKGEGYLLLGLSPKS